MSIKDKKSSRTLIVTISLPAVAIGYVVFFFLPGQKEIGRLRDEFHQRQNFALEADRLTMAIRKVENDRAGAQNFIATWRELAPAQGKLAPIYGAVSQLAQDSGTSITRLDPQQTIQLETIGHSSFAIELKGNFSQIAEFVRGIEMRPETIWITDLMIEPAQRDSNRAVGGVPGKPGAGNNGQLLSAKITLRVFADKDKISG